MTDTNSNHKTAKEEFSSLCHDSFRSHLLSYLINLCADLRAEKPSQSHFNVSDVENIYRLKAASIIPLQDDEDTFDGFYANRNKSILSLRALHCLNYNFFNDGMKKLLPHLVIDALDYDEKSLRALLGDDDYGKVIAAINEPIKINNKSDEKTPFAPKKPSSRLAVLTILLLTIPLAIYYIFSLGWKLSEEIVTEINKISQQERIVIKQDVFSTDEIIDFVREKNEQEKNKSYEKMMKEHRDIACYKKTTFFCDDGNGFLEQEAIDKKYSGELLKGIEKPHSKDPANSN